MERKKTILVVGVGSIGLRHLRCFQKTKRVTISLCETNNELREKVAKEYGIDRAYPSLDAALAESFDAAVIATPAHLHIKMAKQIVEAGSHLLIEKPLSTMLHGVDELQAELSNKKLVVGVAYVLRQHPALAALKQALDERRFGRPVQIMAHSGQHFPTFRPAYRDIYYKDRSTGGGAIQDALTHLVNAGEWLVGPVHRLSADAEHLVLDGVEVEDTVHVLTRQNEVMGCYSLNQHQAPNELTITVVCEQGTARAEIHLNRWLWKQDPQQPWEIEEFGTLPRDAMFLSQAETFLDAIEGHRPPTCTLSEGVQTLRCNLAILASADQHNWQLISK